MTAARRLAAPAGWVVIVLLAVAQPVAAQRTPTAAAPRVQAPSAILVEPVTGDVVFQRRAGSSRSIASTTKLMTALLVLERATLDDTLTVVPYAAGPAESVAGLRAGERLRVADLLRALLVVSANDAAVTLATRVAGSRERFVRLMNQRARQLGLRATHFANPVGLDDPQNYSSAEDLVSLALVLRRNAFFRATVDRRRVTIKSGARPRTLVNRNTLIGAAPFVTGIKTGHTQSAGYVLVGSATRRGVTLLSAVLGDPSEAARNQDTLTLLRFGLRAYRSVRPVRRGQELARGALRYGDGSVPLVAGATVRRTARLGERVSVRAVDVPDDLDGPLPRGARAGTVLVRQRGRTVARVPLVTGADIAEATVTQRLRDFLSRPGTLVLAGVLFLCSLLLVLLRRRIAGRHPERDEGRGPAGGTEVA